MKMIDNRDVMPKYRTGENVGSDDGFSPDWVKDLIITELRLKTATPEGTIQAAYRVLDHYQKTGVNGLWLTPVYDPGHTGNGYGSYGPHTIDPSLTGTEDYEKGWEVLRRFVEQAHRQNIYIFLDAVTWGTVAESPLRKLHPDYYSRKKAWGGREFQYSDAPWKKWYLDQMVRLVDQVGVDGFRCDCEPYVTGYELFHAVRMHCKELGHRIALFSEHQSERMSTYDFDQFGVMQTLYEWGPNKQIANPQNHFLGTYNLVDSVKSGEGIGSCFEQIQGKGGTHRFYSYNTCCHDYYRTVVNDNLLAIGYQAIFAPFIPVMWAGDELMTICNPADGEGCLYSHPVQWELLKHKENRDFFEEVKKMIRIRRLYPEIFSCYPLNHRESNICKVESDSSLQAYARYRFGKGILILPNDSTCPAIISARIPYDKMGMDKRVSHHNLVELMSGKPLTEDKKGFVRVELPSKHLAAILVE